MRIIYMGTPDFAVPPLRALIENGLKPVLCVSQPDRPQGRHQELLPTPVKALALEHDIPVIQPTKVRTDAFREELASYEPDLIVTAAYGRILPEAVLQVPRLGAINVHGSLLPLYRGASPVQAAILNGDEETGVTILRMTAELDAGAILACAVIPLDTGYTADRLMDELAELGAKILPETVRALEAGTLTETPQDESRATYVKLLSREDGHLDFNRTAKELDQQIRALTPWPGAFTEFKGKRCKVLSAVPVPESEWKAAGLNPADFRPGERLPSPKRTLWLACNGSVLALLRFQPAGAKLQIAEDCAHNYPAGVLFGDSEEQ